MYPSENEELTCSKTMEDPGYWTDYYIWPDVDPELEDYDWGDCVW